MSTDQANAILEPAATRVRDPLSGRSLWLAGMITHARLDEDRLQFTLACSRQHTAEDRVRLRDALLRQLESLGWKGEVMCNIAVSGPVAQPPPKASAPPKDAVRGMSGPGMGPHGGPFEKKAIPGVRHVVAVASGKGGVGKSTVATNLAVQLRALGYAVGLMDADIYGPSLPLMMNVRGRPFANDEQKIVPLQGYDVKCMSIGFLVDDREPVIWRGPMVMGVVRQFLHDVDWGDLDVLVIDLPPGTGDAQLTMIQTTPLSGAVIVTTPQDVAVLDARRGVEMFRKLDVPVLGVVENMAWMTIPGGERLFPFGQGGGRRTAEEFGVPLLAEIPLDTAVRVGGDTGRPSSLDDSEASTAFRTVARAVARALGLS